MNVAIVGSRNYPALEHVHRVVNALPDHAVVVSGGARGVDSAAVMYAAMRGLHQIVLRPDWQQYGRAAGFIRNQEIVDAADRLVAFHHAASAGTADSIAKARARGIPVTVYTYSPADPRGFTVQQFNQEAQL
jgi:hypothetical protein